MWFYLKFLLLGLLFLKRRTSVAVALGYALNHKVVATAYSAFNDGASDADSGYIIADYVSKVKGRQYQHMTESSHEVIRIILRFEFKFAHPLNVNTALKFKEH